MKRKAKPRTEPRPPEKCGNPSNVPLAGFTYWDNHPEYPAAEWAGEAAKGNTRLSYWDWVRAHLATL